MATDAQCKAFIEQIAPIVQKYSKQYGYKVSSPIIAQACCESAFGTSSLGYKYHNYFGMKCGSGWTGASVNMKTKEEYTVGTLTSIAANFRAYSSMDEGVKGYFDFISKSRYANLKGAENANQYLKLIKEDGYATSSTYVNTNMNIVKKYNLERFDSNPVPTVPDKYSIAGSYKNGSTSETVYSDSACTNKIGSLNPREECECLGIKDGRAMVLYKVNGSTTHKIGFVSWLGGVK